MSLHNKSKYIPDSILSLSHNYQNAFKIFYHEKKKKILQIYKSIYYSKQAPIVSDVCSVFKHYVFINFSSLKLAEINIIYLPAPVLFHSHLQIPPTDGAGHQR